ncbi:cucumber peeling cupredoxin-like [Cucumis melo]|uniref:Cucumber peeling cupredoxin-like n=2 Tax=Cucumis melo TaxID=3656 RepID=A0A1S3CEF8_CUCME|nr:cucumber peeling cupredoxin-like [Cucumis melo]
MGGGIIGLVLGLIAVVLIHQATAQTVRVVGDSTGWTVPKGGAAFYSEWASKFNFSIGDYLIFLFWQRLTLGRTCSVQEVPKGSFDECNGHNTTHYAIITGPTTVKLDTVGMHYFICTFDNHCLQGQKLAVNVTVTVSNNTPNDNAMSPSSNAAQPPTRTPPASRGDACARTPANSLSSSPPIICDGSSSTLTPSSSTLLMAILYVTLYTIVMNTCFR